MANLTGRKRCPFYGFDASSGFLLESEIETQCALRRDEYLCHMEIRGQTPDWEYCHLNYPEIIRELEKDANLVQVFPIEFFPEGEDSWRGVTLEEWMAYFEGMDTIKN